MTASMHRLATAVFALAACGSKPAPTPAPPVGTHEVCPATLALANTVECNSTLTCTYGTTVCTCDWPEPPCHGDNSPDPRPTSKVLVCKRPTQPWAPEPGCPAAYQEPSAQGDAPACEPEGKRCSFEAERCCERHAECRNGRWAFGESCVAGSPRSPSLALFAN